MSATFSIDRRVFLDLDMVCPACPKEEPLPCNSPQEWDFDDVTVSTWDEAICHVVDNCILEPNGQTVAPRFFGATSLDRGVVDSSFLGIDSATGLAGWSAIVTFEFDRAAFPSAMLDCCGSNSFAVFGIVNMKFWTPAEQTPLDAPE